MKTPLRFLLVICITVLCGLSAATAAPSIAFIPLDNRPPCLDHVQRLAAIAGADLRVPPYKAIGAYIFSGNPGQVEHWLDTLDPAPDYLIVSLDMLAYGGLVASRVPDTPEPQAIARLHALERFAAKNPRTQIFAFSIIQRIARTATGDPDYDGVTDLISKYLKLDDQALAQNDAALAARAAELKARIPERQLADYLAARTRNHAVNRAAASLAASGALDYLVLAMDDNAEYGPHRPERNALSQAIQQAGAADRVLIKPGADEVGQLLLARAVNHARGLRPRVALHFVPPQAADWIAPLEDRPLSAMAAASLQAAGATVATDKRIHGHIIVYAGDSAPGAPAGAQRQAADLAAKLSGSGRAAGVADVRFVNKSDADLAALLLQNPGPAALSAYAGWNTAGNAFGTAAAQMLVAYTLRLDAARGADVRDRAAAQAAFLLQRFADDYLYMAAIRPGLEMELRTRNASPVNIPANIYGEFRARLAAAVQDKTRALFLAGFKHAPVNLGPDAPAWHIQDMSLNILIPWFRLFEIDADVRVLLQPPRAPGPMLPPRVRVSAP